MVIGKVDSIDELFEEMGYEAVFIGSGAGLPKLHEHPGREPARASIPPTST